MVEINMIGNNENNTRKFVFKDDTDFDSVGIVIEDDTFDTGPGLDRDYDVRGHVGVSVLLSNSGANAIDVTILGATKDFPMNQMDGVLVDADFTETLLAEEEVAAAASATAYALVRTTPQITAIRIRAKEALAANPGNLKGNVKAF